VKSDVLMAEVEEVKKYIKKRKEKEVEAYKSLAKV